MTTQVMGFHYTLKDKEDNIIDSSQDSSPLLFILGSGHIIPGLEAQVADMSIGEKKNIEIKAADAYGEVVEDLRLTVQKAQFPEGSEIKVKLSALDLRKEAVDRQLDYYNTLETYLIGKSDYRNVPAPSVAGISEGSISASVGKIITLAEERNKLQYAYKEGTPIFADIDRQIECARTERLPALQM